MTYPSAPKVPRNTTPAEFLAARSACKEHQQYSKEFQLVLMPWSDIPLLHVEKKSRHNQHKKFDITKENCLKVVIVQSHF